MQELPTDELDTIISIYLNYRDYKKAYSLKKENSKEIVIVLASTRYYTSLVKPQSLTFKSLSATLLSDNNKKILEEIENLDYTFLRTIALQNLLKNKNIPFNLSDFDEEYQRLLSFREFATAPYEVMVRSPAKFLDVNLSLGKMYGEFEQLLFACSYYISMKLWPETLFMAGTLGLLFHLDGSLFPIKPKIDVIPADLARMFFIMDCSSLNDIMEEFPKIGILMRDINQEQRRLLEEFRDERSR